MAIDEPSQLYDRATLLGEWRADDPRSYAQTHDARTFAAAVAAGLRVPTDPHVARERALHDHAITRALSDALSGERVVAFMGGHRLERGTPPYELVARVALRLGREGLLVVSGGGPGAMEAAHLGARLAKGDERELAAALELIAAVPALPQYQQADLVRPDGTFVDATVVALHAWQAPAFAVADRWPEDVAATTLGVPTWLYGHEPPTPLATRHAKYFENSIREDGLLAFAKAGVLFAEGKAGTLQEIFQDAAQNYYASVDGTRSPMVFLDIDGQWSVKVPVRVLLDGLFDDALERNVHFVTTVDDAVASILAGDVSTTPPLL